MGINIAIFGATGLVGNSFLRVLEDRDFPVKELFLFASEKSNGKKLVFNNKEVLVKTLNRNNILIEVDNIDIAFFATKSDISKEYAPILAERGVFVVDNSKYFRMMDGVPLIVPEVNIDMIKKNNKLVANPNCSTIQSVLALNPIRNNYGLKRIIYSTYQSVSGSGYNGIIDYHNAINGMPTSNAYKHDISKTCIPQIDTFKKCGYTKEELKMINETKKIFNNYNLGVTATTVRVPILSGHAVSINVELDNSYKDIKEIKDLYLNKEGLILVDNIEKELYPTTIDTLNSDDVFVGRIRKDESNENTINMYCTANNLRKGAASNAVQIVEKYILGRK